MSSNSGGNYGSTIGGIKFPQDYSEKDDKVRVKNESLATCKRLYKELQDALETVAAYIFSYERAVDSSGYANTQINQALTGLAKITDDNKTQLEEGFREDIKEIEKYAKEINSKLDKLKSVYDKLNDFSNEVVRINKQIKDYKIPFSVNDSL